MRTITTLVLVSFLTLLARAQGLTNVTVTPSDPTECDLIDLTIYGTMSQQGQLTGFNPTQDGTHIQIALTATGGVGNVAFTQTINGLGPFAAGDYSITVTFIYNGNFVDSVTTTFTVTPGTNPDAGEFGQDTVCTSDANFQLITVLIGTPDNGGVWTDPVGQLVPSGTFDPGVSAAGIYTYSFDVQAPCQDASQVVLILYAPNNDPGTSATVQVCSTAAAPIDLLNHLGGTPMAGGTWTHNGAPHSGTYVPGTDACGVYTYTVPGIAPCGPVSATVTTECVSPPDAGVGGSIEICVDDSSHNFNNILQGEEESGFWIGPDGSGLGCGYNCLINVPLNGEGAYGYVVLGTTCPNDTAFVNVTLNGPPCTIGVEEFEGNVTRFELMPNPARDQVMLEVELAHAASGYALELLDVNGRQVRSERISFDGTLLRRSLDVSALPVGAYLVRITSSEGRAVRRLMLR